MSNVGRCQANSTVKRPTEGGEEGRREWRVGEVHCKRRKFPLALYKQVQPLLSSCCLYEVSPATSRELGSVALLTTVPTMDQDIAGIKGILLERNPFSENANLELTNIQQHHKLLSFLRYFTTFSSLCCFRQEPKSHQDIVRYIKRRNNVYGDSNR